MRTRTRRYDNKAQEAQPTNSQAVTRPWLNGSSVRCHGVTGAIAMKLTDGTPLTRSLIEAEVKAHAKRLKDSVEFDEENGSIKSIKPDPIFSKEDGEGLENVNRVLVNNRFRLRLCNGLKTTSGDLQSFIGPIVKILLPVSSVSGVASAAVGLKFAVVGLPFTVVSASLVAIMLARFGISYFCDDTDT